KLTALSKGAILASAAAVNRHLDATAADGWCSVLPTFHVGGLGVHARAWLSGARVITASWEAQAFVRLIDQERLTLASLVPAQVRDLVDAGLSAPPSLRAVLVGGGALDADLRRDAGALSWPLLPSYGMTECGSTIAAASSPEADELTLLSHLEARRDGEGRLAFRGSSLLTGYALFDEHEQPQFVDPKVDGWLRTEDLGAVEGGILRVEGRAGDFIKIGGESVDLQRLDRIALQAARQVAGPDADAAVVPFPDPRLGQVIHLVVTTAAEEIRARYDAEVHPFERARQVRVVAAIPRSPLGKLLRAKLSGEIL
ncbi:MAG: MenE O-succinylbenzoate-CoA ligase, partial [Acidobacteria bacterium]|nr:MenE O-succinylbenzoate-CoA ligase [Acidobacteriota bacterium]